jgi:4-diphosphocytidyl-2-C-methyl-D-erythritol kinase
LIKEPIEYWQNWLFNDFEESIFPKHPKIKQLKNELMELGAVYASMSGSGSSLFGIFNEKPVELSSEVLSNLIFEGELS